MGYREFADDDGLQWKAWDVRPIPRAVARGNLYPADNVPGHVAPGWEQGWLAFQSDTIHKRLKPIPHGWETTPEANMRLYLRTAVEVKTRHGA